MLKLLIVADDLTGALDSAAPFARAGLKTLVARRPSDVLQALAAAPEVLAVSTASRDAAPGDAVAAVAEVVAALQGRAGYLVFKKVDSRLKGNAAAETRALATAIGAAAALICPAIPWQNRVVRDGAVGGMGVDVAIPVRPVFAPTGLVLNIPDAARDADLDAILRLNTAPLLVGAAGLAAALARKLCRDAPGPAGLAAPVLVAPALVAIGSRDPITLAQVARLRDTRAVAWLSAPNGMLPDAPLQRAAVTVVQMQPGETPIPPNQAARQFAQGIAALMTPPPGSLFACGGETADAVLGQLGAGVLALTGELLPGVPMAQVALGADRVQLVTKSGGFGAADCLLRAIETIEPAALPALV